MVMLLTLKHQTIDSPQSKQRAHMYSSRLLLLVAELRRMTAKLTTHHRDILSMDMIMDDGGGEINFWCEGSYVCKMEVTILVVKGQNKVPP
jgi:hypothetical protein